jgi:hypothetical protein
LLVLISWLGVAAQSANAQHADGSLERFVWRSYEDGGAARIETAGGGVWIYAAKPEQLDGRIEARFAVGKPARTEYTLFSAEEEEALWNLRQSRLPQPPAQRHAGAHPEHHEPIAWPRVVLQGAKTCVPSGEHSQADDWQQHLVCWSQEDGRVE